MIEWIPICLKNYYSRREYIYYKMKVISNYRHKLVFVGLLPYFNFSKSNNVLIIIKNYLQTPFLLHKWSILGGFPTNKDYNLSHNLDTFKITIRYRLYHKKELWEGMHKNLKMCQSLIRKTVYKSRIKRMLSSKIFVCLVTDTSSG